MSGNVAKGLESRQRTSSQPYIFIISHNRYVPKIDFHILERAASNTPTTVAGRFHAIAIVRHLLALTTQTGLAAVEERRSLRCGPASPVPVWLSTVEPAFYSQGIFVSMSVVSMP